MALGVLSIAQHFVIINLKSRLFLYKDTFILKTHLRAIFSFPDFPMHTQQKLIRLESRKKNIKSFPAFSSPP